jgi:3,4-dihydroxy 2-butanone 4-phosphate synthase / GTP cyclohydrolase II
MSQTSESIVEQLLPDVRKGRMVILVDDEDRENEGDLFVAAERATPQEQSISWRRMRAAWCRSR